MKRFLRVRMAQINTTVGDLEGNREKIVRSMDEARRAKAHLALFPELAVTGYPPEDLLFKKAFVSRNLKVLKSIALKAKGLAAVVGFVDRDDSGRLYNAAALLKDRRVAYVYRKVELPNYGVFDEKRYFLPGRENGVFDLGPVSFGLTICEDIWQKSGYVYQAGYSGRHSFLINISASPYHRGKQSEREALLKNLAGSTQATVLYLNLVGGQDELVFDGGSLVVGPDGKLLARAKRFEEDALVVDIPADRARRPLIRRAEKKPPLEHESEVYLALVLGTRDYIRKNGFKKALIGLSGGIDSALVARIAVDALGPKNVIGVTMPSRHTSQGTYRDAKQLAKNLKIKLLEFKINPIFDRYLTDLNRVFKPYPSGIAEENLQARVRGNILMALSNKLGHLVLTTGNKSEMATGYCTLYGDMAGGFAVIKDVPKTLVFKLARHRNALFPKNSIPGIILSRPPTAELRPNQKDQDTLPPYPVVDKFLELYVEQDKALEDIIREGIPKLVAHRLAALVDGNEYKRRQSPPGVKITPKAFGRDRRMPITNKYRP